MSGRDYARGPGRRRWAKPKRRLDTVDDLLSDVLGPEPCTYTRTPYGDVQVINPGVCGICHKSRHRDIPHHAFEPDRASLATARRLGWPLPPAQEPLL